MRSAILIFMLLFVSSCVETAIIGSAATAIMVSREKSVSDTAKDVVISTKLVTKFTSAGLKKPSSNIEVTVNEQRILLTGIVEDEKDIDKAIKICWTIKDVREVIDEVQVVKDKSFLAGTMNYPKDTAITAQIESKLLFEKNINSSNIKLITVNGVVYLLGVAQDDLEITQVTNLVARIRGVKKVVSHLIESNDRRRNMSSLTDATNIKVVT